VATAPLRALLDPVHEPVTLNELLRRRVEASGGAPALLAGDARFSFDQFDEATSRCAGGLSELGVERGTPVAIMMGNHADFVLAWWGIAKTGAVEVPINTA
jgi:acyl-CoA synthetase (AMP-forming)/AMP-acid ligase II